MAGHLSGKERDNIKREPWKYKIGGKAQGLFPSLLLLILFGVPGILLYRKGNGAFLFFLILAACMTAVLFAVIYRAAFVKVLIYRNGFFHQKSPRKGRFYPYSQIRQAWISSEQPAGGPVCWCSYQTTEGQIFRFPFFLNESDGVDYLIEHVTGNSGTNADTSGRREEYSIDGKSEGITGIAAAAVILILFLLFGIPFLQQTAAAGRWAAAVCTAVGISVPLSVLLRLTVRYCCFRVLIQSTGFYVQTTPFNGKFYSYGEIESCREEKQTVRHRGRRSIGNRTTYYFLNFTDKAGKTVQFPFEKDLYSREIRVLQERIGTAASAGAAAHPCRPGARRAFGFIMTVLFLAALTFGAVYLLRGTAASSAGSQTDTAAKPVPDFYTVHTLLSQRNFETANVPTTYWFFEESKLLNVVSGRKDDIAFEFYEYTDQQAAESVFDCITCELSSGMDETGRLGQIACLPGGRKIFTLRSGSRCSVAAVWEHTVVYAHSSEHSTEIQDLLTRLGYLAE